MKKSAFVLVLIIICCAIAFTAVYLPSDQAFAAQSDATDQTVKDEIKIYLDDKSNYAAYGDVIAYTTANNELVIATKGDLITIEDAYAGECRSIVMNSKYILLLSAVKNESSYKISFTAFDYTLGSIGIKNSKTDALKLFDNVDQSEIDSNYFLVNEDKNGWGGYDLLYLYGDTVYCISRDDETSESGTHNDFIYSGNLQTKQWSRTPITMKDLAAATDFVVADKMIYFVSGNTLYYTDDSLRPDKYKMFDGTALSVTYENGIIYVLSDNGIYAVDPSTRNSKKLSDDTSDGKIRILKTENETYLLAHDVASKSIKQYICTGTFADAALTYYNVFDGIIYNNPARYDLLKVGKAKADTNAYYSPKNLKTEFSVEEGAYILVLAEQDGYYYVRNDEGKTAYIAKDSLALLEASTDTDKGKYAQALNDGTNVYLYPYVSDDIVATIDIDQLIIIINNVATDGGKHVYGWYKVCIMTEGGPSSYGYMQDENISKYTNFKLPSFSKDATVSSESLGGGATVNVYLLPDESSEILGTLSDGDKVTLAQEKFDSSSEWTKIVYKDLIGYVRTGNLITEGLTPLQITLIVVFAVVIVATAIVIVLVVKKRKAQKFDY